jgi:hypothetical protein
MENKVNKWKVATLILISIMFVIVLVDVIIESKQVYHFGDSGISISKSKLNSEMNNLPIGSAVPVCNNQDDKCLVFRKIR